MHILLYSVESVLTMCMFTFCNPVVLCAISVTESNIFSHLMLFHVKCGTRILVELYLLPSITLSVTKGKTIKRTLLDTCRGT